MIASEFLNAPTNAPWARALLLTSVCVKLAAVPMFFWLLSLADELPALVLGLIIAVVDMAAFGEFAQSSLHGSALLTPQGLWLWCGAATSLLAALLMLTQRSLKRLLVLSTVEDVGFLLLGLASAHVAGFNGALIAAATHAMAKALLFICLSAPEATGELGEGHRGLVKRYPFSACGFLLGMLAMLGVPPTLGYLGRWRLYESALQSSPLLLAAFLASSALALIAYVMALSRVWWSAAQETDAELPRAVTLKHRVLHPPVAEPMVLRATIVGLVLVLLTAGIWPDLTLRLLQGGRP
jgi:formate hydrogenlyase subunit 3/multisubunit Na+/H+ antiporter MnhD subunit